MTNGRDDELRWPRRCDRVNVLDWLVERGDMLTRADNVTNGMREEKTKYTEEPHVADVAVTTTIVPQFISEPWSPQFISEPRALP